MTERMKPPARRTGRTLGGAKKAAPPPPPPTAELTPEQYAAEQATPRAKADPLPANRRCSPHLPPFPPRHRHGASPMRCPKWRRPPPSRPSRPRRAPGSRSQQPVSRFARTSSPPRREQSPLGCRWNGRCRLWPRLPSLQHLRSSRRSRPNLLRSTARPRLLAQPRAPRWRFALQLLRRQAGTGSR